ncbi:hypothetical protein [Micromonospora sp. NPDC048063]|uniref:hypothetical protein n=1 Tax=Micromonospora sp. NPDC048063 TaxID=3364256 RepID=UPI003722AB80
MIDIDKGRGRPYSSADWFSSSTGDCDDCWPLAAACAQVERCPFHLGQWQRTVNGTVEHRRSFSVVGVGVGGLNGRVADAMTTPRMMNRLEPTVAYGTGSSTDTVG